VATWYPRAVLRIPAVDTLENATDRDADRAAEDGGIGRAASVAGVVAILAAIVAGATIWLLLTDPVTVATSVEDGEISPLVRQLAQVLYNAVAGLLDYL
jgi:hypothetical protein